MTIENQELRKVIHLIPIILCGGEGARLWPISREMHPKPFIRLDNGFSLLQNAFLRGARLPGVKEILTVTNRELFFKIEDEFREINDGAVATSFILEPFKRNTAAAIASAALEVSTTHGEESLMLVLSADDVINDQDTFQQAVSDASLLALDDKLVTFGIRAEEASSSHSYIEYEGSQLLNFIEKPDLGQAHDYLDTNRYLWHSGIFLFKAGTILRAIEQQDPQILQMIQACVEQSRFISGKGFKRLDLESSSFSDVPDKTIEDIIIADTSQAAVIPCDIQWTSISSWRTLSELVPADTNGNRIEGEVYLHEVENCHIQSDGRLIAAVGVNNLMIIDTHDALLVADKSKAHDIAHIYAKLKTENHEAHKFHRTVQRPWGSFTVLEDSDRFKIKRIEVKPGASLSLQMHHHRSEHWIVVSGMAKVTNGEDIFFVKTNESTYIAAGHKHRLENPGVLNLVMIEVQSGEYLGEDDIVRFQDNYGRI